MAVVQIDDAYGGGAAGHVIPADCAPLFADRTLFISGVGRSGTTIVGKILGSLQPTYYLFEPALLKILPFFDHCHPAGRKMYGQALRSVLLEDYWLQLVHGRTLNFKTSDDSYIGNYCSQADVSRRWNSLERRQDAIEHLQQERPCFIIKMPELQPLCRQLQDVFFGARFVFLVRDGNDVVASALKRGWYSDEQMASSFVDWAQPTGNGRMVNSPWYLDAESLECFPRWNAATRAASVWRCLTRLGMDLCANDPAHFSTVRYEEFANAPAAFVERWESEFGLRATALTEQHVASIGTFKPTKYPELLRSVEEPERSKFSELMDSLGY